MSESTIVALKRVSAYRTSDGMLHSERKAAVRHQAKLDLEAWISSQSAYASFAGDDLAGFMLRDADHLVGLLRKAAPDDEPAA